MGDWVSPVIALLTTCNATAAPASSSLTSDDCASATSSRENSCSDTGKFRGGEGDTVP